MDLAPGSYDTIRANLAHVSHRRWLEAGWQNYHATLLRWAAAGLRQGAPYARFHAAIATAGENTAQLTEKLLRYKVQTAVADVGKLAYGGWHRASSSVSVLIGDTKIREPRAQAGLVTPEQLAALRARLRPGDIVIERRNWYLSNAFTARLLAARGALPGHGRRPADVEPRDRSACGEALGEIFAARCGRARDGVHRGDERGRGVHECGALGGRGGFGGGAAAAGDAGADEGDDRAGVQPRGEAL